MVRRNNYKVERNAEIARLRNECNMTYQGIADMYNLTRQRVKQIVKEEMNPRTPKLKNAPINTNLLLSVTYRNGLTMTSLAEKVGVSESTMSRKIRSMGDFNLDEIMKIKKILNLTDYEFAYIFLTNSSE